MRFERENINVIEFAQALSFDAKIKAIKEVLDGYANEIKPEEVTPDPLPEPQTIQPTEQ
jgi:hypothetical protein